MPGIVAGSQLHQSFPAFTLETIDVGAATSLRNQCLIGLLTFLDTIVVRFRSTSIWRFQRPIHHIFQIHIALFSLWSCLRFGN